MNCQFCGAAIPDGDQFCGQCGARAPVAPGTPPPPPMQPQTGPAPTGESALGARPGDPLPSFSGAPQAPPSWRTGYFQGAVNEAAQYEYAGFWIRFGAWLLDTIFIVLLAAIPAIVLAIVLYQVVESGQEPALTIAQQDEQDEDLVIAAVVGLVIPYVIVSLAYQYIAASLGGGWGKRICGLRIVKKETGARPGFGTGAIRTIVVVAFGAIGNIPLIGWLGELLNYLWMIWDEDKQTFHDKAAGTVVVHV
jgi:uncharacterized RDD family membrane protein YckC